LDESAASGPIGKYAAIVGSQQPPTRTSEVKCAERAEQRLEFDEWRARGGGSVAVPGLSRHEFPGDKDADGPEEAGVREMQLRDVAASRLWRMVPLKIL